MGKGTNLRQAPQILAQTVRKLLSEEDHGLAWALNWAMPARGWTVHTD